MGDDEEEYTGYVRHDETARPHTRDSVELMWWQACDSHVHINDDDYRSLLSGGQLPM